MRKILCLFLILLIFGGVYSEPFKLENIKTPADLEQFFVTNGFKYQEDTGEYWKTPEETLNDKGGDCEDFAILSFFVLVELGYECIIIIATYCPENECDSGSAHAMLLIKEPDETYSFMSNRRYIKTYQKDLELALTDCIPSLECLVVVTSLQFGEIPNWYSLVELLYCNECK